MAEKVKKLMSIVLMVAMIVTNNGLMVLASSVGHVIDQNSIEEREIPNYYYEETTTIEEYQAKLEFDNPEVFEEETDEESEDSEGSLLDEKFDMEEEAESDETEESSEIVETDEIVETSEVAESDETVESSEIDETSETANLDDAQETIEEETTNTIEQETETGEVSETETSEVVATDSEVNMTLDEEIVATESNIFESEDIENVIATKSEIVLEEESATISQIEKNISTTSELSKEKEQIVATISKTTWKVKKVLIATFASISVKAGEVEEKRQARLATYANVIIVDEKGNEKVVKVNVKWQLFKKYNVNAKSKKNETPISAEEWRKTLKIDELISEQQKEVIATSNIAKIEERVKEENKNSDEKEYIVRYDDEKETEETIEETTVKKEETIVEITEESIEPTVAGFVGTEEETEEQKAEEVEQKEEETEEQKVEEVEQQEEETEEQKAEEAEQQENETEEQKAEEVEQQEDETEEKVNEEETEETQETSETSAIIESQEETVHKEEIESKEEEKIVIPATVSAALTNDGITNDEGKIIDSLAAYYDVEDIYIYKVDVPALGDEIINAINETSVEESNKEVVVEEDEKKEGFLDSLKRFFGAEDKEEVKEEINEEEISKEDDLLDYLEKANVDVIEDSEISPIFAEQNTMRLSAGATHTSHSTSINVNGEKINSQTMGDFNKTAEDNIFDLNSYPSAIKETDEGITVSGSYYLAGNYTLTQKLEVEEGEEFILCLNGNNITFATAGFIRGNGRLIVCNCGGESIVTTGGPQYNWHDIWYATTNETYTKWNEHSLFACAQVGVFANANNNIVFKNSVIKNQYIGRKALSQMADTVLDEPETSGDGSLVFGKNELQMYGIKFENNKATRSNGVAANAMIGKMTIENCSFTGNKNLSNKGGAVAFNPKATVIHNCTFKENVAFTNGGALYGKAEVSSNEGTDIGTVISKTTFDGNKALQDGGAIFIDYLSSTGVNITGTEANKVVFKNNIAGVNGGAISVRHHRAVEGQDINAYSYEDGTSKARVLNIDYATFDGNSAEGLKMTPETGVVSKDATAKNENHGGAIYLDGRTITYATFPSDAPVKTVGISNSTFENNYTKGIQVDIKKNTTTLATYNVGNYGGAIFASDVANINIDETVFNKNKSITGGNLCVKNSTVNITGGELSEGKAYNNSYNESEFYQKIVSPGGGAAYVMVGATLTVSAETKVKKNENAFYLDGGSIDLGGSSTTDLTETAGNIAENKGEYLIGYTNNKTNRILFSGVDIRNHNFNETRKDYASFLSDASIGERKYDDGVYATSYVSFKNINMITNNRRIYRDKTTGTVVTRNEEANIVLVTKDSNLKLDLKDYLFDVPYYDNDTFVERIGLNYTFDPENDDRVVAFASWNSSNVKVISEGGLWTNYFSIDNSKKGESAEGFRFFIENTNILMSKYVVEVNFDSYIDDIKKIKPQYFNYNKDDTTGTTKIHVAVPTEITRGDIVTPGRTFVGFLGVDKANLSNTAYADWDFATNVIDGSSTSEKIVHIVPVYTNDTMAMKPCGVANGTQCNHLTLQGVTLNHQDRGNGTTLAEKKQKNYIEVATYPQLSYRYNNAKTQYMLNKDFTLTADKASEFINGGLVLMLNGHTLTYDTGASENDTIFKTLTDEVVYINGKATSSNSVRGKIVARNHKGSFITGNSNVIFISDVDVEGINTTTACKAFISKGSEQATSTVRVEQATFSNIKLVSDLIDGIPKVYLDKTVIKNVELTGNVVSVKASSGDRPILYMRDSEVDGLKGSVGSLFDADHISSSGADGARVLIDSSMISNNTFTDSLVTLDDATAGSVEQITLSGNTKIYNNKSTNELIKISSAKGEMFIGTDDADDILIDKNTVTTARSVLAMQNETTTIRGKFVVSNSTVLGNGNSQTVYQAYNTQVKFGQIAIDVSNNNTTYDWFVNNVDGNLNPTYSSPVFTQLADTKLRASESCVKIRLERYEEGAEQVIYENWSKDILLNEKEAEETFKRDDSYGTNDKLFTYKRGKTDRVSDICIGTAFTEVIISYNPYKADVDERQDSSVTKILAPTQRVGYNTTVELLLDAPQFEYNFVKEGIMWETFGYKYVGTNEYDYSREIIKPRVIENIRVRGENTVSSLLISGYQYNPHMHDSTELWIEARNEGHLQATNSFAYLHNDITITHPILTTTGNDYYLCLNGHKLTIAGDVNFINANCNLVICDCKKSGSIAQTGTLTHDFIVDGSGTVKLQDIKIGPFENIEGASLFDIGSAGATQVTNVLIDSVNANYGSTSDKAFININSNNNVTISDITLNNNTLNSNAGTNAILAVNNSANSASVTLDKYNITNNRITANNANGDGYILRINGYNNVTFSELNVTANESLLGAPLEVVGSSNQNSVLNLNQATFTNNVKKYIAGMAKATQISNGISANLALRTFGAVNIDDATFTGSKFNTNNQTVADGDGAVLDIANSEASLMVRNTTFDGTGVTDNANVYGIALTDKKNEEFNNCQFSNYNLPSATYMYMVKTAQGSSIGKTEFKNGTVFTNNVVGTLIHIENTKNGSGDDEGSVLFDGTEFTNNKNQFVNEGLIELVNNTVVIASGAVATNTTGTTINALAGKVHLMNTSVTGNVGSKPAIDMHENTTLYVGEEVIIKGSITNVNLRTDGTNNAKIAVISGKKISKTSLIYITAPDQDYNFFDEWESAKIENYNYHDDNIFSYLPTEIFKLDAALSQRKVYISGAANSAQKLYISAENSTDFATLIFYDREVEGRGELLRQYIKVGGTVKLDLAQVGYIATLSQAWMVPKHGTDKEAREMWKIYISDYTTFEVVNYQAGETYYAYLTRKHTHKICGLDVSIPCNHMDNSVHDTELEFTSIGSTEGIIVAANNNDKYLGLAADVIVTQTALDALNSMDEIVICLNGYKLKFEAGANLNTGKKDLTIVNCNKFSDDWGITVRNSTNVPLINAHGSNFNMYNVWFRDITDNTDMIKTTSGNNKVVWEGVKFTNVTAGSTEGFYSFSTAPNNVYIKDYTVENCVLRSVGQKINVGSHLENILFKDNTYIEHVVQLEGTGSADAIKVEGNQAVTGGYKQYGPICIDSMADVTISSFSLANQDLIKNPASEPSEGGALYIVGKLTVTGDLNIENCKAVYGGAVYLTSNGSLIVNGTATFKGNEGNVGAAIYAEDWSKVSIANAIYDNNIAKEHGVVAWGKAYSGNATFKNHTSATKELLYNLHDDGSDSIAVDTNTVFINNNMVENAMTLNKVSGNIAISNESTGNKFKNFVESVSGSIVYDDVTITGNQFTGSVFDILDPVADKFDNVTVSGNTIANSIISVQGNAVTLTPNVSFAAGQTTKDIYIAGENGYVKAEGKFTTDNSLSISAYTNGVKVFENWSADNISLYDEPQQTDPGKYAFTPENSEILTLAQDAVSKSYEFYKVGSVSQAVYIGKVNEDFVTIKFANPDDVTKVYVSQNIEKDVETKLDKVNTFDFDTLTRQRWTNASGVGDMKVLSFAVAQTYRADREIVFICNVRHFHKICGLDSTIPCNHMDNTNHGEGKDFISVGSGDAIILAAQADEKYISLSKDVTVSQNVVDALNSMSEIVICLSGYNLYFEKDVQLNTSKNITFTNCKNNVESVISVQNKETGRPLINVNGSTSFGLYNVNFKNIKATGSIVSVSASKIVNEKVSFTDLETNSDSGIYNIISGDLYSQNLTFERNKTSGDTLIKFDFTNVTGHFENVVITNNTYVNKLLALYGTGNMEGITMNNNSLLTGSEESYGAVYVGAGAKITYSSNVSVANHNALVNPNSKGGAFAVYGELIMNRALNVENAKAGYGGAIYVSSTGSLNVQGEAYFKANEAKVGGAIYAEDWSHITMASVTYDANIAKEHGVVAWGKAYSGKATFKNHTSATKELLYNLNEDGSDSITIDDDTMIIDNNMTENAMTLRKVSGNIGLSYLSNNNKFKNFIEMSTSSMTFNKLNFQKNTVTETVLKVVDPVNVSIVSSTINQNKIQSTVIDISGGPISIGADVVLTGNTASSGKLKEVYISGENAYVKAANKLLSTSKIPISAYTSGIKVFEKWDANDIDLYDKPQRDNPGKFSYTPENSGTIILSDDAKSKGYSFYKVGDTASQDIYLGKANVDFVTLKFVDPENDDSVFTTQNIEKGKSTKLDKIDTFEFSLSKQKWIATASDGTSFVFNFSSANQVASLSEALRVEFIRIHVHKVCGLNVLEECNHDDGTVHSVTEEKEYVPVYDAESIKTSQEEYLSLGTDIEITEDIELPGTLKSLCLNGHTITFASGSFINRGTIDMCNCKSVGGITANNTQDRTLISSEGSRIGLYKINFNNIDLDEPVISASSGVVYTENVIFEDNKTLGGINGSIGSDGAQKVYLANVTYMKNDLTGKEATLLNINNKYVLGTVSFISNTGGLSPIVDFSSNMTTKEMTFRNNTTTEYDNVVKIGSGISVTVGGDLLLMSNNSKKGALYLEGSLTVNGETIFEENYGLDYAAVYFNNATFAFNNSLTFENNKTGDNGAVVGFEGTLTLEDTVFRNNKDAHALLSNAKGANDKLYLNNIVCENNGAAIIDIVELKDGKIENIDYTAKDTISSFMHIASSSILIKDIELTGKTFTDDIIIIKNTDGVRFENVNISKNELGAGKSAVTLTNAVLNIQGNINLYENTTNISFNDGDSYLKANGMLSRDSKMSFNVNTTSQKVFEGWSATYIEDYGLVDKTITPIRHAYTPENSGLFYVEGASLTKKYEIFKSGTGDTESVYVGDPNTAFTKLVFRYTEEDGSSSEDLVTQNIGRGELATTKLDTVDTYEYGIDLQMWHAPDAQGTYNIKWEFKNEVTSTVDNYEKETIIKYVVRHIHKVCGIKLADSCVHEDSSITHDDVVLFEDATTSTLWPTSADYIRLIDDVILDDAVALGNIKGICLNGHKLIIGGANSDVFALNKDFSICDCKANKTTHGDIEVKEGVVLHNSIFTLSSGKKLELYNIHFENIALGDDGSTKVYVINNNANGSVYLDSVEFTNTNNRQTEIGEGGLFASVNADNFVMSRPVFDKLNVVSNYPLLTLNGNYKVSTMSMTNNVLSDSLIKVTGNSTINGLTVKGNRANSTDGLITVDSGTLTMTGDATFENNEASVGGLVRLRGTLDSSKEMLFKNNKSDEGGAVYVESTGKINSTAKVSFVGNIADTGSAIYADNINENSFDVAELYFEANTAKVSSVVYWSGALNLTNATFTKHVTYDANKATGVNDSLITHKNSDGSDKLVVQGVKFVDNSIANAAVIKVSGLAEGSKIIEIGEDTKNNTAKYLIDVNGGNMTISGTLKNTNTFTQSAIRISDATNVMLNNLTITNQVVSNSAVYVAGGPVFVKDLVYVANNKSAGAKVANSIYLADNNSFLKGVGTDGNVSYIDEESVLEISVANTDAVKVFEGWDKYNFAHYDNSDFASDKYKYAYTPENSGVFVVGAIEKAKGLDFYKSGLDGEIYLGAKTNYVKLKYYNDVEEVEGNIGVSGDKQYYVYQNIAKDTATKLDKVDSHEYEIEKQEWYVGYVDKNNYDHLEKFNPANPVPTNEDKIGVIETFSADQEIKYHQLHIHKVCGYKLSKECEHLGHANHTSTVEYESEIMTLEELESATGYVLLVRDIVANRPINLSSELTGLCLNGHTITGNGGVGLFNLTNAIDICNCRVAKNIGAIITSDRTLQSESIFNVNTSAQVGLYNLTIKGAHFTTGYAVNVEAGNVYVGGLKIIESNSTNANGIFTSATNMAIDNLQLVNNTFTGIDPVVKVAGTIDVHRLYLSNNIAKDSIVVFDKNTELNTLSSIGNKTEGKGAIFVSAGNKLSVAENIEVKNNISLNGAGIYVAGTFETLDVSCDMSNNTAANNGGAIYVANGGKIKFNNGSIFDGNIAVKGAAIYAENAQSNDLVIDKAVFTKNNVGEEGVIAWGGELELTDVIFDKNISTGTLIANINKNARKDKIDVSSISFIDNKVTENGITLTNVVDDSSIKDVTAKNNTFKNLILVSDADKINVTNVKEVTSNTFTEAGIALNDVTDAVFNNIEIKNNTSNKYGVVSLNGASTKVYSVGKLTLCDNTNTGDYGSAITILSGANLEEDGGLLVTGNRANKGGAIYLDGTLGVESQGTTELKVVTNYIGKTNQTKNILVMNNNSYVYATGMINEDSQLGFTANTNNLKVFEKWSSEYISKFGNTDKYSYTPNTSGLFVVDTLSANAKQQIYKSGVGNNVVLKLGTNFAKLSFVSAGRKTIYSIQNIERDEETALDKVVVENDSEKWIAPNSSGNDYKWVFANGTITANYNTADVYIYKSYKYKVVFTPGSKEGNNQPYTLEYGESLQAIANPYSGRDFKYWALRKPIQGIPLTYKPGSSIKNVCEVENGVVYLDAMWGNEAMVRFNPNGGRYGLNIPMDDSYTIITEINKYVRLVETYPVSLGGSRYDMYTYSTEPDGSGKLYKVKSNFRVEGDVTIYLIWDNKSNKKGGGGGSGGGGMNSSGGTIHSGEDGFGPGMFLDTNLVQVGGYTIDSYGNIRDSHNNIVGNIYLGDRVNADGSFTASNGVTIHPNGLITDKYGNTYNLDGSITTATGITYYTNGDVKDATGTTYHADGSITLPNGVMQDASGILHYPDGSITLTNGITYYVDGTIKLADGVMLDQTGKIVEEESVNSTPGTWNYDPTSNNWKFESVDSKGVKTTHVDEWISTKNAQGENAWYMVDSDGNMFTGWVKTDGEFYYMSKDATSRGEMVTGTKMIDGKSYTFDEEGKLISGDKPKSGFGVMGAKNHTSGEDGDWKRYSTGEKYFAVYFEMPDRSKLEVPPSGWYMIDGYYYYFDEYGIPQTGLVVFDDKYYYFNEDGTMQEGGEVVIDGKTYVFDKATGACRTIRQ